MFRINLLMFSCVTLVLCSACTTNLHSSSLKIGVVNEAYSDSFNVQEEPFSWNDRAAVMVTDGELPPGVELTGDGRLIGTPGAVGDFDFRVTAYAFSYDFWDDSDDVNSDSEWFTLFVTEASTNPVCPRPDDKQPTEIYFCLGNIEKDNLATDEVFTVDVNYFIDFTKGHGYDIFTLDFSILYDAANFTPVEEFLDSQILREAATRTGASVSFDSEPGQLNIVITASVLNLHKSGRLMDLPFKALTNVAVGEYPLTVVINGIGQQSTKHVLPTAIEVDGFVEITDGVYETLP